MKNKKTIKYKASSPMNYQFGGIPLFDQFNNLNKQWGNFWKAGNYFKEPEIPITGVYADPSAVLYNTVNTNNKVASDYTNNQNTIKNTYNGEWGDDAHNYYYNKTLNGAYTPDQLAAFSEYEKKSNWNDFWTKDPEKYDAWYQGRENYAKTAGNLYDAEQAKRKVALSQQPEINKQMGAAFTNTASGIFSGLNYQNAYKEPEPINLQQGFQGVQYAQYGNKVGQPISNYSVTSENPNKTINAFDGPLGNNINFEGRGAPLDSEYNLIMTNNDILESVIGIQGLSKNTLKKLSKNKLIDLLKVNAKPIINSTAQQGLQEGVSSWEHGGNINLTGYTPGSSTELNKSNTIPGGDISMKDVKQDLIGIVKGGGKHGLITKLEKGKEYSFGSDSVTELPINPIKQEEMLHAQFGVNIANPEQLTQYPRDQYLQQIAGSAQYGPLQSSAAFNNNMLTGYQNSPQVVGKPIDPYNPSVTNGIYPQQAAYTQPLPGDTSSSKKPSKSEVYSIKGDRTYEYSKDSNGEWLTRKKGSTGAWIYIGDNQDAVSTLDSQAQLGTINPVKTASGNVKTTSTNKIVKAGNQNIMDVIKAGETWKLRNSGIQNEMNGALTSNYSDNLSSAPQPTIQPQISNSPVNNPYGFTPAPGYVPLSTNSYRTSPQDEQVMRDGLYGLAGFAGGNLAGSLAIKGITSLPKVGKVVQYGSKYIDKAGNYVSKAGDKLGKVPKKIMDVVNKDLYKNFKATPDTWDDLITKGVGTPKFANPANYTPGVRNAWAPVPKQYGGLVYPVPLYQFGGPINNDYTYPIHPITEEFTEIQTEKGEVVSLPDFTIVNVKADKLHKHVDKNDVTDILPAEAYVFSDDDKMKLHLNDKIGGVAIKDMKLGKSVFEYKENEITTGPKDIYFSKLWGKSNELTPAELVNNVKKKFEVRDQKDDFFVERANVENKEQRSEYLDIIKALSEYKKPKSKRIPKAQYGLNVGLPKMYNQPTNNALDGIMGYSNKVMDPYYGMDNNVKSMYNISSSMDSKLFENGGEVPHAQFGFIGAGVDALFGFSKRKKEEQERLNQIDKLRYEAAVNGYVDNVQRTGNIETTGALAGYAASLNVPNLKYNDNSSALATMSDSFNRRNAMLNAQKYSALNSNGAGSSMARYTTSNNDLGAYLAAIQGNTNQLVAGVNDRQVALEGERAGTIADLTSRGLDNYNSVFNNKATQLYNANVAGMGNISGAAATANANSGQAKYQAELDKLSYQQYQRDLANQVFDKNRNKIEGYANDVGNLGMFALTGGFSNIGGGGNNNQKSQQPQYSDENPYGFNGTRGYDMSNYTSNPYGYQQMNQPSSTYPGFSINRRPQWNMLTGRWE